MPPTPASAPPPSVPAWFRTVVWDSLLGSLCPLLPVPVVDDLALAGVRRRLIGRLLQGAGLVATPSQVAALAGRRPTSPGRLALRAVTYPVRVLARKVFRKVFYVLSMKEAVDTFSRLFHEGYLLAMAVRRGDLGSGGPVSEDDARRVGAALAATLDAVDTRPLGRLVGGVFRASRSLVVATGRWLLSKLRGKATLAELEAAGESPAGLSSAAPSAEALLERLIAVLWGEEAYRHRLELAFAERLAPRSAAGDPVPPATA